MMPAPQDENLTSRMARPALGALKLFMRWPRKNQEDKDTRETRIAANLPVTDQRVVESRQKKRKQLPKGEHAAAARNRIIRRRTSRSLNRNHSNSSRNTTFEILNDAALARSGSRTRGRTHSPAMRLTEESSGWPVRGNSKLRAQRSASIAFPSSACSGIDRADCIDVMVTQQSEPPEQVQKALAYVLEQFINVQRASGDVADTETRAWTCLQQILTLETALLAK